MGAGRRVLTMTPRRRRHIPVAPGQLTLPAALHAYPEALAYRRTHTGTVLVLLDGGAHPTPTTPVIQIRRAAA